MKKMKYFIDIKDNVYKEFSNLVDARKLAKKKATPRLTVRIKLLSNKKVVEAWTYTDGGKFYQED